MANDISLPEGTIPIYWSWYNDDTMNKRDNPIPWFFFNIPTLYGPNDVEIPFSSHGFYKGVFSIEGKGLPEWKF